MRTFGDSIAPQELQPYADWCKKHDIIIDESDPAAYENAQVVAEYFINTWKENITPGTLEQAFSALQPYLKFVVLTPAQIVQKTTGFTQAEALISILTRRALDSEYLVQNGIAVAQVLMANGWSLANVDQALTNMGQQPGWNNKVHWASRRLQDNEKRELQRRESARKDLEQLRKTRQEQASIEQHPELRLSEKARAHREMLNRPPQKVQMSAPAPEYSYWKGRCESAIASLPVMDRAEAQQLLDAKKGGSYESAYSFIMTFVNRRTHERANAASLARMGR